MACKRSAVRLRYPPQALRSPSGGLFFIGMAYVYILRSSGGIYYTGSCADLAERLLQHKNKEIAGSYTALSADDWELYLSIADLGFDQCRKIEQHIKRMKSRVYIENLKRYLELAAALKERYK